MNNVASVADPLLRQITYEAWERKTFSKKISFILSGLVRVMIPCLVEKKQKVNDKNRILGDWTKCIVMNELVTNG